MCILCSNIIDEQLDCCEGRSKHIEEPKVETQSQSEQAIIYVYADEDAFKINAMGKSFYVCLDAMSGGCDYFRWLMKSNLKEAREKEVTLKDLNPRTLEEVIRYCHIGTCSITKDNVAELILVASRLQNNKLLEQSCGKAKYLVNNENYMKLFILGTTFKRSDLIEAATFYFTRHFMEAILCDDYTKIDYDDLYNLYAYTRDALMRSYKANFLMEAIFKWFNGYSRQNDTPQDIPVP